MELAVVAAIAGAGLLVVLVALVRDEAVEPTGPPRPDWDPLPSPSDLARTDFGLRVPGYDPATVEVAFDALADAYADLLAEADPTTIARARRRASDRLARTDEVRQGAPAPLDRAQDPEEVPRSDGPDGGSGELDDAGALRTPQDTDVPRPSDPTGDALRAEAALDALRRDGS